ncbi:MAG: FAD-dependent oxidoreductase [Anaerolineae bacterium]
MDRKGTSRRGFLKGSVIAGAGALAAQGSVAAAQEAAADAPVETYDFDVVIVGAGAAGMWAALEAQAAGAKVALLEKHDTVLLAGCALCGGCILASNTKVQKEEGIEDTWQAHLIDHMRISRMTANPELVALYAQMSGEICDWFYDRGVEFKLAQFVMNHELPVKRAHWTQIDGQNAGGKPFAENLIAAIEETDVEVFYLTPGKKLITNDEGAVVGILAENADGDTVQFNAKAVILCTGGFPANHAMLTQYHMAHFESLGYAPGASGDGINMGAELGAILDDMDRAGAFQLIAGGILGAWPPGNVLNVNIWGKRYAGEHSEYMITIPAIHEQPDRLGWMLFDSEIAAANGWTEEVLADALSKGLIAKADTIVDLAKFLFVDADAMAATVEAYNAMCEAGEDTQFGKPAELLMPLATAPFYAARLWPSRPMTTYGGMVINTDAQVIGSDRKPIVGLYAAGDDTCGLFGKNYPGSGTGIGSAMAMGRIAGRAAAAFAAGGDVIKS